MEQGGSIMIALKADRISRPGMVSLTIRSIGWLS